MLRKQKNGAKRSRIMSKSPSPCTAIDVRKRVLAFMLPLVFSTPLVPCSPPPISPHLLSQGVLCIEIYLWTDVLRRARRSAPIPSYNSVHPNHPTSSNHVCRRRIRTEQKCYSDSNATCSKREKVNALEPLDQRAGCLLTAWILHHSRRINRSLCIGAFTLQSKRSREASQITPVRNLRKR